MSLRLLIVDDEVPARARLKELLADVCAEVPHVVAGEATNGLEALDMLERAAPDVVLVDIHMPGMTGMEFARHLQLLEHPPAIVFITAHDQFAVQAFEINAVDYLLKPVRATRLAAALVKASAASHSDREVFDKLDSQPRRYFSITERGRIQLVPVADVQFLRSEQKYVTLHTKEREYLVEESLSAIEDEFPGLFVRIHRSCLAARRLIRGVEKGADKTAAAVPGEETEAGEGWLLTLEGCAVKLPISRRQWTAVKTLLKT